MNKLFLHCFKVPSVNHYWLTNGKTRYISADGLLFKKSLQIVAKKAKMPFFTDEVAVCIDWVVCDKRRRDLDNILKPVLDSLIGICYKDDSQVSTIIANKIYSKNKELAGLYISINSLSQKI